MAKTEGHHHSTTPPGWTDMILGFVCFILVSEGVRYLVITIKPEMEFSRAILTQMQLSGALFFVVWATLGRFVFEPFLESAVEREKLTEGAAKEAQRLRESSRLIDEQLQATLRESRLEGIRKRDQQLDKAKQEAAEIVEAAKRESDRQLADANRKLELVKVKAEATMAGESEALAQLVVDNVLEDAKPLH